MGYTQIQMLARAEEVKAMMNNPDVWEIEVWENSGWHWSLMAENVRLSENTFEGSTFWAMCSDSPGDASFGHPPFSLTAGDRYHTHPQAAVDHAVGAMLDVIAERAVVFAELCEGAAKAVSDKVDTRVDI